MRKPSEFQVEIDPIASIVREAVDQQHMSLSEIAAKAGLSVPTISRIYTQEVELVQAKSARRIAEALGYEIDVSKRGESRLRKIEAQGPKTGLSSAQKAKIRKAVMHSLEDVLNQF